MLRSVETRASCVDVTTSSSDVIYPYTVCTVSVHRDIEFFGYRAYRTATVTPGGTHYMYATVAPAPSVPVPRLMPRQRSRLDTSRSTRDHAPRETAISPPPASRSSSSARHMAIAVCAPASRVDLPTCPSRVDLAQAKALPPRSCLDVSPSEVRPSIGIDAPLRFSACHQCRLRGATCHPAAPTLTPDK